MKPFLPLAHSVTAGRRPTAIGLDSDDGEGEAAETASGD